MVSNKKLKTLNIMGLFRKRHVNLQPWLDYFEMLQEYERNGYLEVSLNKGEAYITQAALCTLSGTDKDRYQMARGIIKAARHIRAYVGWKGRFGREFLLKPFALQVVKDDKPHDMVYTILLSRRRRWWKLWMKADVVNVFNYTKQ